MDSDLSSPNSQAPCPARRLPSSFLRDGKESSKALITRAFIARPRHRESGETGGGRTRSRGARSRLQMPHNGPDQLIKEKNMARVRGHRRRDAGSTSRSLRGLQVSRTSSLIEQKVRPPFWRPARPRSCVLGARDLHALHEDLLSRGRICTSDVSRVDGVRDGSRLLAQSRSRPAAWSSAGSTYPASLLPPGPGLVSSSFTRPQPRPSS